MCPCCYRDAPILFLTSIQLRTLGKMKSSEEAYNEAGSVKRMSQKFKNCINFPLLCDNDNAEVLDQVPPSELHLLLGTTNKSFDELNTSWGDKKNLYKWAYKQCIARADYRGGSMEGNQCQMALKKAAALCQELPEHFTKFGLDWINFLRWWRVISVRFSTRAVSTLKFEQAYLDLGISVTPKSTLFWSM